MRDDGNQEFNEAKRAKEDAVPRNLEENCNRFNRNKNSYQWNNAQNQGKIKEEIASTGAEYGSIRSNIPQHWKNVRNQGRNSPNLETGAEREKDIVSKSVGDEGNYGRFKRHNSPYNRRYQNQGRNEGRSKEEDSYFGGNIEDNSNRYNRNKTYRNWKNFRNQGRNSPGMEVEARRIKEETAHINVDSEEDYSVEGNSSRCNRNNTAHPWKNIHNQGRNSPSMEIEAGEIKEETSAPKNVESEENCNAEDNSSRYNRNNSTHPWKNLHNQGRNSPNFEVEAKKMKEETSTHTNFEDEERCSRFKRNNSPHRWKNTQYQDRNSPDMYKDRQQGREFRKDIKEDIKDRNRHQEDDRRRGEELQQKQKIEKFGEDLKQGHKQSESSRSNRDEKQRKHDDRSERRSGSRDKHDRRHRSNSKDRHRSKNDRTNEEKKERKLSVRDDKDLEVSNAEKLKYNEPDAAGINVVNTDHYSDKLEAYHEKHNETAEKINSNYYTLDSIQNKIDCRETLQEKTKKLNEMVDYHREINQEMLISPEEAKQKTNRSITESIDILRADLNISNDSTGLPANTSDVGCNAISTSSNINKSVDKNLSASFNSSNVSDDLSKKVTPTFRRRRCVMSFKN